MKKIIIYALVCLITVSCNPSSKKEDNNAKSVSKEKPVKNPNFIIIFTDDQGYNDLGCYGSPDIKTPNIDQMATEGMRFTSFYSQTVCGPARAAIMTGCYPMRNARNDNGVSPHPKLALSEVTIAEVLKPLGYTTGMIGKWDLAGHHQEKFNPDLFPMYQGFDYSYFTPTSNDTSVHLLRNKEVLELNTDMSQLTHKYTEEAIDFIEKHKENPFFLYLAHTMPHTKLAVSKEFKGKSERGLYGDIIEEIDYEVGRILETIRSNGLDNHTYVIFTSDNGPWWIQGEDSGSALPLRGAKTSAWEGGLRVPFIVRAPGKVPKGTTSDLVTSTLDLLPTIANIAGAKLPKDRVIDGIDISTIFHSGETKFERPYFFYLHQELRAVRLGKWKLHLPHNVDSKSISYHKWPMHIAPKDRVTFTHHHLYDLENDIAETTDVSADYPKVVAQLTRLLDWAKIDIGDIREVGINSRPRGEEPYLTPNHLIIRNKKIGTNSM